MSDNVEPVGVCLWPKFEWYAQLRRHRQGSAALFEAGSLSLCLQPIQHVESKCSLSNRTIGRGSDQAVLCGTDLWTAISLSHFFETILLTMIEILAGIFIVQITYGDLYDPCIIVLGCAIIMFSAELFHMGFKSNSLVTVYHRSKCTHSNCEMPLPCCLCHASF